MNTKLKYLRQQPDGLYRYYRKVPLPLQGLLRREVWHHSLGRDHARAIESWFELKREHDSLIERLKDGDQEAVTDAVNRRVTDHFAATERLHSHGPRPGQKVSKATPEEIETHRQEDEAAIAGIQNLWRQTGEVMEDAEGAQNEYRRLATHLLLAFADDSYSSNTVTTPEALTPIPPLGGERRLWDLLHSALRQRLEEIAPMGVTDSEEHRISHLLERYISLQGVSENTARAYRGKVRALTTRLGDRPLPHYNKARLQAFRDLLIEETDDSTGEVKRKASTVVQHFAPLKALWRWAADEVDELNDLQFPAIRLPRPGETVDEIRWQAFDDKQIKRVWSLLNDHWGPDSESKMKPARREAFLMAVKVMLYTGLRPSEVFKLDPSNVSGDVLLVRETKTTGRRLPICKHLSDFPGFLARGGFNGERSKTIARTFSDNFVSIIRAAGITNDRLVLYSLKDTLVERLQRQEGMSDDVIRGIIGHVGGQGNTRHYKTRFGDTSHGMERMRRALDAIEYW